MKFKKKTYLCLCFIITMCLSLKAKSQTDSPESPPSNATGLAETPAPVTPMPPKPELVETPSPPATPEPEPVEMSPTPMPSEPELVETPSLPTTPKPEIVETPSPPATPEPEIVETPSPPTTPEPEIVETPSPPTTPEPEIVETPSPPATPEPEIVETPPQQEATGPVEVQPPSTSLQAVGPEDPNTTGMDGESPNDSLSDQGSDSQQLGVETLTLQPYEYDPRGKRDPFLPLYIEENNVLTENQDGLIENVSLEPLLPLERFDVNELKLRGIIWDTDDPRVLFIDPDNKSHVVRKNDRVGSKKGYLAEIREGEVIIAEPEKYGSRIQYNIKTLTLKPEKKPQ